MAAIDDGHHHDKGTVCPGCKFKAGLTAYLAYVAGEPEAEWHDATGELIELMGMASTALVGLRADRFDGGQDENDCAAMAAAAISRLGGAIQELWAVVMPDDDDPGAGL